ncbi:hypothetical protein L873DRAFT_892467 [Choiromyces venosus 120613-1]|uniref:Uncharacterized protein n=1 Tax=Choiromyces venosus 120613-1 TaxID=1336337 RepID=A0A3N4JMW7_9PEZI|nr:hypothetical protein L873DRAFT_892467 [Choiromyces venosus 120613-1]
MKRGQTLATTHTLQSSINQQPISTPTPPEFTNTQPEHEGGRGGESKSTFPIPFTTVLSCSALLFAPPPQSSRTPNHTPITHFTSYPQFPQGLHSEQHKHQNPHPRYTSIIRKLLSEFSNVSTVQSDQAGATAGGGKKKKKTQRGKSPNSFTSGCEVLGFWGGGVHGRCLEILCRSDPD